MLEQQQQNSPSEDTPYLASNNRARVLTVPPTPANPELVEDDLNTDENLNGLPVDDVDDDVDDNVDDELPELGDLPDDPESEEEDEFTEGSPRFEQFKSDFQKAFGLPMEEARDLVQSLKQDAVKRELNEQKYELSSAWDVPVTEVDRRLAIVAKMWAKLPADKKQAYDSTRGAQVLYTRYEQQQAKKGSSRGSQSSVKQSKQSTDKGGYMFTQKQIDSMDAATYSQNADAIMIAYAQGRVKR